MQKAKCEMNTPMQNAISRENLTKKNLPPEGGRAGMGAFFS